MLFMHAQNQGRLKENPFFDRVLGPSKSAFKVKIASRGCLLIANVIFFQELEFSGKLRDTGMTGKPEEAQHRCEI